MPTQPPITLRLRSVLAAQIRLYSSKKSKKASPAKPSSVSSSSPLSKKDDPDYDYLFGWSPIMSALHSSSRSSFPVLYLANHFQEAHALPLETKLKYDHLMEWITQRGCLRVEFLSPSKLESLTIGNEKGHQGLVLKAKKLEIDKATKLGEFDEQSEVYSIWSSDKESTEVEFDGDHLRKRNRRFPFFVGMILSLYLTDWHGNLIEIMEWLALDKIQDPRVSLWRKGDSADTQNRETTELGSHSKDLLYLRSWWDYSYSTWFVSFFN